MAPRASPEVRARCVKQFRERNIVLPTFAQLADPSTIPEEIRKKLADIDPDAAHPLNLFRIHWYNTPDRRGIASVPGHVVLPPSLTGVKCPIIVVFGERFPMITAHKVLAAYGCLAPRLVNGEFDPTVHKALWPSTGNYCRGGVSVSKIMGCRGVAILPEMMSKERFEWLDKWIDNKEDIIKTYGCESNVKEIYDTCNDLHKDPNNVIFNQFCEFGNVHCHYSVTGQAFGHVFKHVKEQSGKDMSLFAYTSATGSAGTLSAGDRLKDDFGAKIACVESQECPTLLYNGFGDHNIQGIGDKHVPFIHNTMNSDFAIGVSDAATDSLSFMFTEDVGQKYLRERRGVPEDVVKTLPSFGYSGIANTLAAIKIAKYYDLDETQAILTVATDGADLYASDKPMILEKRFGGKFDEVSAAEAYSQYMLGIGIEHFQELTLRDKQRMFNLGYYTWVEQQGKSIEEFKAREKQSFWNDMRPEVKQWDKMIEQFNADVAGSSGGGSPSKRARTA
jgi:cysteine synthase A